MKYNKKRNTAFLYEALVLEMTKAIINNDNEVVLNEIASEVKAFMSHRPLFDS